MRDDDDIGADVPEGGRVYHSGIRREHEVEPAEYALPPGVPALQDSSFESAVEADGGVIRQWPDRRQFMALAIGVAGVAGVAFVAGRSVWSGTATSPVRRLAGKRLSQEDLRYLEIVRGYGDIPIENLVKSKSSFMWAFTMVEPDAQMLRGLKRLCEFAVFDGGEKGSSVAVRILGTFERVEPPPGFQHLFEELRDVVLRWQVSQDEARRRR